MKKTIRDFTDLFAEFHPELNGKIKPEQISYGSKKMIWWQCPSNPNHVYQMRPNSRTSRSKSGCPYCAGKKTIPEESIASTHISIANEWDPERNEKLNIFEISYGSGKKVWWKCEKGHSYEARVSDRTINNSGCPYCAGKITTHETSLQTLYPEVANEWHTTKNGDLTPLNVKSRSNKKVWFTCPVSQMHDYQARIADRTDSKKVGCPYCAGVQVAPDTSLEFKFPHIAKEWHPTKNGELTPDKVSPGSGKSIWWICKKGHEYKMQPHARTFLNRGCNKCSKFGSSQETRIYCELKHIFSEVNFREKISGFEIDMFIPSIGIGVEYDGAYFHLDRVESDTSKNTAMNDAGFDLIRVREAPLSKILNHDVITQQRELVKKDLNNLLMSISEINSDLTKLASDYIAQENFLNESDYSTYMSYFPSPFPENSLAETHQEITEHWDVERNSPLSPYNFTHGSKHKAFWICANGHSHKISINSKVTHFTSKHKGCGYCSGRHTTYEKSLAINSPKLAKEWHPVKNQGLKPEDVSINSDRNVWWQCPIHPAKVWQAKVRVRLKGYARCRKCHPIQKNSIDSKKVKELLKKGLSQKMVAEQLGISRSSVQRLK